MTGLLTLGAGHGPASASLPTPFQIAGANEFTTSPTSGTNPLMTTTATAPAGSVIVVAVLNTGDNAANLVSFGDSASNSYSLGATPVRPYGAGTQTFAIYATGPIASALPLGATMGPTLDASTRVYMAAACFPGATTVDPEAPAFNTGQNVATATVDVPANATQPQYVFFSTLTSSQGRPAIFTAPYTDIFNSDSLDSPSAGFGIRGWVQLLTTTSGSPTTFTATFSSGGGGVSWGAGQRTVA
jgi:hypothetical protein